MNVVRSQTISRQSSRPSGSSIPIRGRVRNPGAFAHSVPPHAPSLFPTIPHGQPDTLLRSRVPFDTDDQTESPIGPQLEPFFDHFLENAQSAPFPEASENSICDYFGFEKVIFWQNHPTLGIFYSPTLRLSVPYGQGLVCYCSKLNGPSKIQNPRAHPSFHPPVDNTIVDAACSVFMFPVYDQDNFQYGVFQLWKSSHILDDDVQFGHWFSRKLKLLPRGYFDDESELDTLLLELGRPSPDGAVHSSFYVKAAAFFDCRACEIWEYHHDTHVFTRYSLGQSQQYALGHAGLVGESFQKSTTVNLMSGRTNKAFNSAIDTDESFLCVPIGVITNEVFGIVLRGSNGPFFTFTDEKQLRRLTRHIAIRLSRTATATPTQPRESAERDAVFAFRELCVLAQQSAGAQSIVETALENARSMIGADRYSLFLISNDRSFLTTLCQKGLSAPITIPLTRGVAGHCVGEGKAVAVDDANRSPLFDSTVDDTTGFVTKSIAAVPLFNGHGDVIGCTEMLNRAGGHFRDADLTVVAIFNLVCGLAAENLQRTRDADAACATLAHVRDAGAALVAGVGFAEALSVIVRCARLSLSADSAGFHANDDGRPLLASDGTVPRLAAAAERALSDGRPVVDNACVAGDDEARSACAVPVTGEGGGGVLIVFATKPNFFGARDVDRLGPFAAFCGLLLANRRLCAAVQSVSSALEVDEQAEFAVPAAFVLAQDEVAVLGTMDYFAPDFDGTMRVRQLFYFFGFFNLFELFQISGERFFRFCSIAEKRYKSVPYHNWNHACDVTQALFCFVTVGRVSETYEAMEIFALLTAAICHDMGHEGFGNAYFVALETPMGILYREKSVTEIHHAHETIAVITDPSVSLFSGTDNVGSKKLWRLLIRIILATDLTRLFELVNHAQVALDDGSFVMTADDMRLLGLQLLMQAANLSNVARPFEIAEKWLNLLYAEALLQGDIEKAAGVQFSSPMNDRNNGNMAQSQIAFYHAVCLPLFTLVARLFPPLQVQLEAVRANLEIWRQK
jgi:3',5'-cyclic-nucleotide phosphodiesterase